MSARLFLDTNILAYTHSESEAEKREFSVRILRTRQCVTSVQALNEFSNVCLKKFKYQQDDVSWAVTELANLCEVCVVTTETLLHALRLHGRYRYTIYDCLMLASALEADCAQILTEDLSDGQIIEGALQICNPFTEK